MITLHRLNNSEIIINCNMIESIESTPDSVITLQNDKKIIVREKAEEIINSIIEYQRKVFKNA
ncbi:MAG TPA: flagellar FlbD family protein, partial [Leptospiraceae bacterium]|nr:flagellar FlbD family protein [Leptospiraceae bacterium]